MPIKLILGASLSCKYDILGTFLSLQIMPFCKFEFFLPFAVF